MGEFWSVGNLRAFGVIFPLSPRPFSFVRRILRLCLLSLWLAISMSPRTAAANHFAVEQTRLFVVPLMRAMASVSRTRGERVLGVGEGRPSNLVPPLLLLDVLHPQSTCPQRRRQASARIMRRNPQGNSLRFTAFHHGRLSQWARELANICFHEYLMGGVSPESNACSGRRSRCYYRRAYLATGFSLGPFFSPSPRREQLDKLLVFTLCSGGPLSNTTLVLRSGRAPGV